MTQSDVGLAAVRRWVSALSKLDEVLPARPRRRRFRCAAWIAVPAIVLLGAAIAGTRPGLCAVVNIAVPAVTAAGLLVLVMTGRVRATWRMLAVGSIVGLVAIAVQSTTRVDALALSVELLAATLLMTGAILRARRVDGSWDRAALLDSAIVATALLAVSWANINSIVGRGSTQARLEIGSVLAGLVLCSAAACIFFTAARPRRAALLLALGARGRRVRSADWAGGVGVHRQDARSACRRRTADCRNVHRRGAPTRARRDRPRPGEPKSHSLHLGFRDREFGARAVPMVDARSGEPAVRAARMRGRDVGGRCDPNVVAGRRRSSGRDAARIAPSGCRSRASGRRCIRSQLKGRHPLRDPECDHDVRRREHRPRRPRIPRRSRPPRRPASEPSSHPWRTSRREPPSTSSRHTSPAAATNAASR